MRRPYGSGQIYEKWGSYYGRWRSPDGRPLNHLLGRKRAAGSSDGLTRAQAEKALRRLQAGQARMRLVTSLSSGSWSTTCSIGSARDSPWKAHGARTSRTASRCSAYHNSPAIGATRIDAVRREHIEQLATAMIERGLAPKTARNTMTFLGGAFAWAVERERVGGNPVTRAARLRRRRQGEANPDLQFLTLDELTAVIAAIPDRPAGGDRLGPVLRVVILAAASTGLRQSEVLGLRWRDIHWRAQRIRVGNTWVRGEHSGEGKSDLSTKRSAPRTSELIGELVGGTSGRDTARLTNWCSLTQTSARLSIGSR